MHENHLLYQEIYLLNQQLSNNVRFEKIIESLLGGFSLYINVVNRRGNIIYSNGAGLLQIGLHKHQLEGKNIFKKYPYLRKFFKRAMKGKLVQFSDVGDHNGAKWRFRNWLIPVYHPELYVVNIGLDSGYFRETQKPSDGKTGPALSEKWHDELEREGSDKIRKVAHDLRSPLNSIAALMEIIEQKVENSGLEEEFAKTRGIIQRMKSLIITHLNANQKNHHLEDKTHVDCGTLIEDIKTDLSGIMGKATITVKNKNLPVVYANATHLHQLFLNLIDNAIKFNDKKRRKVLIKPKELKKKWLFAIEDNGIGIKRKHQTSIFQYKKRIGKISHIEGSGIGLSTCKTIVENHGGKIWVKSRPGKGSIFYFTLPK